MYHQKLTRRALASFSLLTLLAVSGPVSANPTFGPVPLIEVSHARTFPVVLDLNTLLTSSNGAVSYAIVTNSSPGVATGSIVGSTLTVNMVLGGTGNTNFQISATDLDGPSNLNVPITSTNSPPNSLSESYGSSDRSELVEDYSGPPLVLYLQSAFADPDGLGDTLTYALISNTGASNFTPSGPADTVTLFPNPDVNGTQTLVYQATDLAGATGTISVELTVDPVNDQPQVIGSIGPQAMVEDQGLQLILFSGVFYDVDVLYEGENFDSVVVGNSAPALVTVNPIPGGAGVALVLTPNMSGTANIAVALRDDGGLQSVPVGFTLTVDAVNDPVVVDNPIPDQGGTEDAGVVTINVPANVFSDVDGAFEGENNVIMVASTSDESMLSAGDSTSGLSGNLDLNLTENFNGSVTVTIAAEDDEVPPSRVETDFVLTIDPLNDAPFLSGDVTDLTVNEDSGPHTVEVLAEFDDIDFTMGDEPDSHTPIFISNDNPGLVSVVPSGSGVQLTLAANQSGSATIEVGVEDLAGSQATDTFVLTVDNVNDPVVKVADITDRLVNEDSGSVSVNITGTFADLDPADSHTVTVVGNTDSALVTPLTAAISSLDGTFDFAIAPELSGISTITLEAEDASGSTATASFAIEVVGLNDPPFVALPLADQTHDEDAGDLSISFAGVFDDPDLLTQGDVQNYTFSIPPSDLITSASISGDSLSLSFGENQNGNINITIEVTDKEGLTAADTFQLVVNPVPDDPFVKNPIADIGVNEDAPDLLINLNDVFDDPDILTDGEVLTYTVTGNTNPTLFDDVRVDTNILTLVFAANQFGTTSITIEARDETGTTVSTSFNVNVTEIFPTAFDDSASMDEDGDPITIDVLANDDLGEEPTTIVSLGRDWPDVNPLYTEVSSSEPTSSYDESGLPVTEPNGYLSLDNGKIVYRPKENYYGVDTFEYTISDSDGDLTTATVTVTVAAQDDPPRSFAVPTYTVSQGSFLDILEEGGLLSFAVDDDGNPLEVRYNTVPSHSIVGPTGFVPNADGSFLYTPEPGYGANFGESDSFEIYYWDEANNLGSDPVTVIINFDPTEADVAAAPAGEVEYAFDLADVPLEDAVAAEANVLVMMDDSGSMDWTVMTPSSGGEFRISNASVRNSGVTSYARSYRYVSQHATNIYGGETNVPTEETLAADGVFAGNNYGVWRARSAKYSTVYYNPEIRYTPWIGLDRNGDEFTDVPFDAAPLDPFDAVQNTIDLNGTITFKSRRVPGITQRRKTVTNSNVYLPYYYDTTAVGLPDWDAPHAKIVIDEGQFPITLASGATVSYYPGSAERADCAADDDDPLTCTLAQEKQNFANWFSYYRSREYSSKAALGRAVSSASNIRMGYAVLNNASERVRIDSLNASYRVGHKKELMDQVYSIVSNGSTPLRRALDRAGRHFECRSGDAFGSTSNSSPGDPECPILASPEGQCQNNFTLLFSDGTWNQSFTSDNDDSDSGSDPSPSPFDGGMFEDTVASTLADVAMYYYERDLHPGLEDGVPTTQRDQDWAPLSAFQNEGEVMHQHMKTYTVGFGLQGNIDFADLPLDYTEDFTWGNPFAQGLAKIDDMLHAAVNGRGEFLQANNPVLLSQAFAEAFEDFSDGSVSVSAVAFNSTALREETVEYRGFFNLKYNSGDLRALSVDSTDGTVDTANPLWQAAVQMDDLDPSTRKIVTWDDGLEEGIVFEYANLNADQKATLSEDQVAWLRGDNKDEEPDGILRAREEVEGRLGDIVHSAPQFVGAPRAFRRDQSPYPTSQLYSAFASDNADRARVVYVAANDGMLHGFDAGADASDSGTGDEVFAYVPNKIIDSTEMYANELSQLTSLVYAHRFFVDLTPSVEDVFIRAGSGSVSKSWNTLMVGGLRGGGKGYFALNVTDPDNSYATATSAKGVVLWEFTDEDDFYPVDSSGDPLEDVDGNPLLDLTGNPVKDLGYAFAQPQIVMTNAEDLSGDKKWMAVFGNGYNSTAGIGKLFLLDVNGGIDGWEEDEVIKISSEEGVKSTPDPLAGLPNGIGTPALVDVDANGTADLAYAGDLFGNFYRFDIRDTDPDNWTAVRIFQATYDGTTATRQPITTQPYVFKHPTSGFMVVFATGSYITEQDGTSTDIQSLYGLWDRDEDPAATRNADAKFNRLVEQEVTNIVDVSNELFERQRLVSANEVAFEPDDNSGNEGVYGWYMDLDMVRPTTTSDGTTPNPDTSGNAPPAAQYPGERAIRRFIARGDALLISTVIPRDANTCFRAPPGAIWPIDALSGGNPKRPILDLNNDGVVDDNDLFEYEGQLYATGILFDQDDLDGTLVDPSLLVGQGDEDFLFLSGGDDQVTLRIAGPEDSKTGRLSWRELEEAN